MGNPRRRHRRHRLAAVALVVLAGLAACSSSPSETGAGREAGDAPRAARDAEVEASNRAYLLELGFEEEQARCVSRKVTVDLEQLLSASDGGSKPTEKPGFEEFADATRSCIAADSELTTTTAPTG